MTVLPRDFSIALTVGMFAMPLAAQDIVRPALVEDVVAAATQCMMAANLAGVDTERLTENGWSLLVNGGDDPSYGHPATSAAISLPSDDDDVQRICVVEAALLSPGDVRSLAGELSEVLRREPMEQTDSMIWMVNAQGARGIQLYDESSPEQPRVRLIGAHFTED